VTNQIAKYAAQIKVIVPFSVLPQSLLPSMRYVPPPSNVHFPACCESPAIKDTLASSDQQRKRQQAIDQGVVVASESRVSELPCLILSGVDNNHKTYGAFIVDYINKWRPFEVKYGQEWQVNKAITICQAHGKPISAQKPWTLCGYCTKHRFHTDWKYKQYGSLHQTLQCRWVASVSLTGSD
jgi:hypothetical protein